MFKNIDPLSYSFHPTLDPAKAGVYLQSNNQQLPSSTLKLPQTSCAVAAFFTARSSH